jgi:hypothetical protein
MAAGLGFKDFVTGEVLTAADVDGYLMQGIWVFASAAARDAAVTSPQEGNACYLKDTNQVLTYSGSAWVAVGGGSPLTTKGDLYTFSTVDARLGVGANDSVLTADSTAATGLKWATPSAGGFVGVKAFKSASQSLSNATQTIIDFDSEDFDTNSFHSTTVNNSRFTIPSGKAGKYLIVYNFQFSSNGTGTRIGYILKNGSVANVASYNANTGGSAECNASVILDCAVSDYLELRMFQDSGGAVNAIGGNNTCTNFSLQYLGA